MKSSCNFRKFFCDFYVVVSNTTSPDFRILLFQPIFFSKLDFYLYQYFFAFTAPTHLTTNDTEWEAFFLTGFQE